VTAKAYQVALQRAGKAGKIHAVVVMTDGKDESSSMSLEALTKQFPEGETPVKVFTITYGKNADPKILEQIAEAAGGAAAKGNVESIVQVYEDMASFF
jgi:Ca-activated chloride channel family protein